MNRPSRKALLPLILGLALGPWLLPLAACQAAVPTPAPTPYLRPTIETVVEQQVGRALDDRIPALQSTIAARVSGTVIAALPTPLPQATPSPTPPTGPTATVAPPGTPTPTPSAATPIPTPVPSGPTATAAAVTPTPTQSAPTATPTQPAPTATPTQPAPTATPTPGADFLAFAGTSVVRVERSSGGGATATAASGVIVETSSAAGTAYVLTNAHVTASARRVDVVVEGTTRFTGKVIGEDVQRDLALIEICCGTFSAVQILGTAGVETGRLVGVVGYPTPSSTSTEVATATVIESRFVAARERFEIVLDRALSDGLSGAAVFDSTGRFAGLATGAQGVAGSGTAFAIAPATIVAALPSLRDGPIAVIATPTPSVPTTGGIVFGPASGALTHDPVGGQPITLATAVDVADAIAVATFTNPYATSEGSWSYGLRFRSKGTRVHTVFVRSDGAWHHWVVDDQGNPLRAVQTQASSAIAVASGATNTLRIMAIGGEGYLFVNSTFIARLDLSGLTSAGDVIAVTGLFTGDQLAGKSTAYKDLTVTKIGGAQSQPSGSLIRSTAGFIATESAGVNLLDTVVDVRFTNPSPAWSYGVLLRQSTTNSYHAVIVAGDGYWYHHARTGTTASDHQVQRQKLTAISTVTGATNRLQVFASGADGWLFVNGQYAGRLDLSEIQAPGDVRLMAGYFTSDQAAGVQTRFDSFSVRPIR